MTANSALFQRRTPKQARSRATVEAIVEAAAQVLERKGPEGLTTNGVAERAGVSIGTLYQYFPDKQALLLAAARRELDAQPPRGGALMAALIDRDRAPWRPTGADRSARAAPSLPWQVLRNQAVDLLEQLADVLAPAPPQLALIRLLAHRRR